MTTLTDRARIASRVFVPGSTHQLQLNVMLFRIGAASGSLNSATGGDRCLCDIANQRPDLLSPNGIYLDNSGRPGTQYLNPAAFGQPALGTLGNMGRTILRLPMTWQFDIAVSRNFQVREAQRMELRVEAFNVTNTVFMMNPTTNISSNTFGQVLSSRDPRIMQFALKYVF